MRSQRVFNRSSMRDSGFPFQVELLQPEVGERAEQIVEANVIDDKAIELVSVDGDVTQALRIPTRIPEKPSRRPGAT